MTSQSPRTGSLPLSTTVAADVIHWRTGELDDVSGGGRAPLPPTYRRVPEELAEAVVAGKKADIPDSRSLVQHHRCRTSPEIHR